MNIGFTGTRKGMTDAQKKRLKLLLKAMKSKITRVHHGDCIGADSEFHYIVDSLNTKIEIIIHPPTEAIHRAHCPSPFIRNKKSYLARNRDIVNESELIIATPKTMLREGGGGTWYTINFAKSRGKRVIILEP